MIILSHRGFWRAPEEKNAPVAFRRTLGEGFGTETDVRDQHGALVVAHDPPGPQAMPWAEVVAMFEGTGLPLAVNVKADGLAPLLKRAFAGTTIDWFAFDMSGPETVRFAREDLPFFTRHSDIEPEPVLYAAAQGVWLDAFDSDWFGPEEVSRHVALGKRVCIVSPDLHGRPHLDQWRRLGSLIGAPGVMLCTDHPDQAKEFFRS